jgi:16S rRNA processing protein RimM
MASRKPASNRISGSPAVGGPEYLVVGRLRRPHGLRGELLMEIMTDFPERLTPGTTLFVGSSYQAMRVAGTRTLGEKLAVTFLSVQNRESAAKLSNQLVYVASAHVPPLPDGLYYHHELAGFQVVDAQNAFLGTLSEIIQTGANDVYVVTTADQGELLVPAIPSVVLAITTVTRTIQVRLLPGLEEASRYSKSGRRQ